MIRNGIDAEVLSERKKEQKHVVFLGRIEDLKNPLLFVDIMRVLRPHGYSGAMVGGGKMEGAVRARISKFELSDKLILTGRVPHEEALERLAPASVMVMTSRWEGMSIAALEAMAMGVPVIAPDISSFRVIIRDGVHGILVPPRDPAKYAEAVMRICGDEVLEARITENSIRHVNENFTLKRVCDEYERLHMSVHCCHGVSSMRN